MVESNKSYINGEKSTFTDSFEDFINTYYQNSHIGLKQMKNSKNHGTFLGHSIDNKTFVKSRKNYQCDVCGHFYSNVYTLNLHKKYKCGKEPKLKCKICDQKFHFPSSMYYHLNKVHKLRFSKKKKSKK